MVEDVGIVRETAQARHATNSLAVYLAVRDTVTRLGRALARRFPRRELVSFAAIGVLCTLLFVLAYHVTRSWLPPLAANGIALTSTAGLNFAANRQFTFPARQGPLLSQAWWYFVFYVVGLGLSSLALSSFLLLWHQPPRVIELTAALLSGGLATAVRYVSMALWVFRRELDPIELRSHLAADSSRRDR